MKQLIFMIITTLFGTIGVVFRPFWGVAVYYLFATLRPQFLWEWVPYLRCQWSRYVAIATIAATFAASLGIHPLRTPGNERIRRKFGRSQSLNGSFCLMDLRHLFHGTRSGRQAFRLLRRVHQDLRNDGGLHGLAVHV